jgi:menaquinone-9 beta-reductase
MTREVRIFGGGLAGLALGIALRQRDIPATVHEALAYPRHRVCGEFLCGLDPAVAEALGLSAWLAERATVHHSVAWFRRGRRVFEHALPQPVAGVSRFALDGFLAGRFAALGGSLVVGARADLARAGEGDVVAAGSPPGPKPRWLGLKQHVRGLLPHADLEMHLGNRAYAGVSRVEENVWNVCGLFDPSHIRRAGGGLVGALERAELGALAAAVRAAQPVEGTLASCTLPRFGPRPQTMPFGGGIAVGDRSSMIPPFTGHGMAMALERGAAAAEPLARWAAESTDWETVRHAVSDDVEGRFRRRTRIACALHPALLHPIGATLLALIGRARLLPIRHLYQLTHS